MKPAIWNGIKGKLDVNVEGYKYGNAMFYPDNGIPFYRICVKMSSVEQIDVIL